MLYLEIRLKKTSECFVQWRNRKTSKYHGVLKNLRNNQRSNILEDSYFFFPYLTGNHAWGLNFVSEEEAQKFLDFCHV